MNFTKLFSSITESTVWCEPAHTRLVWITMLAMADRKGRVWASIPGLANRARVPMEDAEKAIATFLSPDKHSRTPDHEGRRIEPIDGGWQLLNHAKYRDMRDEEVRREQNREAQERKRAKSAELLTVSQSQPRSAQAEAEADTEADKSKATSTTTAPDAARRPPKKNGAAINFNFEAGRFDGIKDTDELRWQEAYPAIAVPDEIGKAAAWMRANPANRKKNYERYIVNWLSRAQEKAGRVR
jgi:hypothetical protein